MAAPPRGGTGRGRELVLYGDTGGDVSVCVELEGEDGGIYIPFLGIWLGRRSK